MTLTCTTWLPISALSQGPADQTLSSSHMWDMSNSARVFPVSTFERQVSVPELESLSALLPPPDWCAVSVHVVTQATTRCVANQPVSNSYRHRTRQATLNKAHWRHPQSSSPLCETPLSWPCHVKSMRVFTLYSSTRLSQVLQLETLPWYTNELCHPHWLAVHCAGGRAHTVHRTGAPP